MPMSFYRPFTPVLASLVLLAACQQSPDPGAGDDTKAAKPDAAKGVNLTWAEYDRPVENGIVRENDVAITMSDGIILRGDVYRPDVDGKFPVVVELTPYNKGGAVAQKYG